MAQTERNDWHKSIETGGIVYSETVALLMRRMQEDSIPESCIDTFEKIIKKGKKFNTFLTMATQRPAEITLIFLSQSHNYVIHKLVNASVLSVINNTVPFLDLMSSKMIPILSSGQAIFIGTAFSKPNIVNVNLPKMWGASKRV